MNSSTLAARSTFLLVIAAALLVTTAAHAQKAYCTGDIAVTGSDSDLADQVLDVVLQHFSPQKYTLMDRTEQTVKQALEDAVEYSTDYYDEEAHEMAWEMWQCHTSWSAIVTLQCETSKKYGSSVTIRNGKTNLRVYVDPDSDEDMAALGDLVAEAYKAATGQK
jgi:hypothetical protein